MSIRSLWVCALPALAFNPLFTCGPTRQKLQGMEQELQSKSLNCQAELYNFFQLTFPPSDVRVFTEEVYPEEIEPDGESSPPTPVPTSPTLSPSTSYWLQLCSNCQKLSIQFTEATTHYTWDLCFRDFQRRGDDSFSQTKMFAFAKTPLTITSATITSPTISPTTITSATVTSTTQTATTKTPTTATRAITPTTRSISLIKPRLAPTRATARPTILKANYYDSKKTKRSSWPPIAVVPAFKSVAPTSIPTPSPTFPIDCSQLQDLHTSLINMVHQDERVLAELTKSMRQGLERMRETLADRTEARRTINMSTYVQCSGYQPLIEFETDVVNRGLDLVVALEAEMKERACPVRTSEVMAQWWSIHQKSLLLLAVGMLLGLVIALKCALVAKIRRWCWPPRADDPAPHYGSMGNTSNKGLSKKKPQPERKVTWATVLSLARSPTNSRQMSSPEPPRRLSPSLSPWTPTEGDPFNLDCASYNLPSPEPSPRSATPTMAPAPTSSPCTHSSVFGFLIHHDQVAPTGGQFAQTDSCAPRSPHLRPPSPPLPSTKDSDDPDRHLPRDFNSLSPLSRSSSSSSSRRSVSPSPGHISNGNGSSTLLSVSRPVVGTKKLPVVTFSSLPTGTGTTTTMMTLVTMTMTVSTTKTSPPIS